ncbi:hypothetical protein ACIRTB_20865 [Streptomyces sp. NPDC101158]|uniref:hypothetical protein n=1 Tax=Streptomyces sp. NPDC101158 TaxID=3366117 RepID=UPI003803DCA1
MSIQDPMAAAGPEPGPGRQLTIPLRYPSGTGIALAGSITAGITWQYIPPDGTWPLVVLGTVAMVCDTVIIAIRARRRTS